MNRRVIDLGWCMARLDTTQGRLTIVSPADQDEGGYGPAASVVVYGSVSLMALRDALNEAYPPAADQSGEQ